SRGCPSPRPASTHHRAAPVRFEPARILRRAVSERPADATVLAAPVACADGDPMRFTWFNLMPWPHLPDDFRQKYRSVWVDIPSKLYDPVKGHALYHTYLDQLEYADQLGFDGVGVNEHHANGYGLMPSPNIMAAALSRRTSRAAIVDLGNSIA